MCLARTPQPLLNLARCPTRSRVLGCPAKSLRSLTRMSVYRDLSGGPQNISCFRTSTHLKLVPLLFAVVGNPLCPVALTWLFSCFSSPVYPQPTLKVVVTSAAHPHRGISG